MTISSQRMTPTELRTTVALSSIISLRMLGLFMILPVFAIYAQQLPNITPTLIGLAIGIYGLTQAILQIPFGMLSDRIGRKPVITLGLFIFAIGSIVAALSTSIIGIIIGRALQGGGAIASATLALTADLIREEHRTKAMATLGMSIGTSFLLALVLGPLLSEWIGIPGIFWLTALFAAIAITILHSVVPTPVKTLVHRDAELVPIRFKSVLFDNQLLRLNVGVLLLHCLVTSLFIELPLALKAILDASDHWYIYLPVLVASVIAMIPFIILAEKYHHLKLVFTGAIGILIVSQLGFAFLHQSLIGILAMLFLFFTAFNLLEASLPSLVSKIAHADSKGTAMGIFSSAQFLGAFLGGAGGGWLHRHYNMESVFIFGAILAAIWFILAATMQRPRYLSSHLLKIGTVDEPQARTLTQQLSQVAGVIEVIIVIEEETAYLKIDRSIVNFETLNQFSVPN